ncbi:hypothetical protein AYI69_g11015 [Smittium culicis]|uniref:Uncharacterized protein n=1 Tax=Smittium culicis TaxID=133412 RepID=A0A1R1X1U9_9FUNG|nr:hypothetical protein AYI69_g11015 [Smittium culicis]
MDVTNDNNNTNKRSNKDKITPFNGSNTFTTTPNRRRSSIEILSKLNDSILKSNSKVQNSSENSFKIDPSSSKHVEELLNEVELDENYFALEESQLSNDIEEYDKARLDNLEALFYQKEVDQTPEDIYQHEGYRKNYPNLGNLLIL